LIKKLENSKEANWFSITKDLYSINKWESVFWIPWLITQIKNKNLETYQKDTTIQTHNITTDISWNQNSLTETLLQELLNISFFTITDNKIILKDTVIMTWYLHLANKDIKTNLLLERYQNNLIIKSVNLQKYSSLSKVINNLIKTDNRWINKMYQYIIDNIDTYWVEDTGTNITNIWFCDILKTKITYNIIECSDQNVLIEKDWINYRIFLDNQKAYDVNISDKTIETTIKTQLQKSWYNDMGLIETIQWILDYKTQIQEVITWNQNSILITEIFQKYLWIVPNDVVESKWSFFLNFQLKKINFIAEFSITDKVIKALYFQDISTNWKPLNIKQFSLLLDDKNKTEINQFLINPINYIQNLDSFAYINYQNKFGK
jgi:hypothetical protein